MAMRAEGSDGPEAMGGRGLAARPPESEPNSPKLAPAQRTITRRSRRALLPSGLDGEDKRDDPYVRWTALKDNWWQPFTDGFQHSANAVGETPDGYWRPQVTWNGSHSTPAGDLVDVHRAYAEFLGNSSALSQAWDHDRLYALNNIVFGAALYTCHFPRKDEDRVKTLAPGAVTSDPIFLAISNWEPPAPAGTAGCNLEHVSDTPSTTSSCHLWRRCSPIPHPATRHPTHPATPPPRLRTPCAPRPLGQHLPPPHAIAERVCLQLQTRKAGVP